MKISIGILVAAALLVAAVPAAAGHKERVGPQINLMVGTPASFPANTSFHVAHGWLSGPATEAIGKLDFRLEIDGEPIRHDFVDRIVREDGFTLRVWVRNFPAGLPAGPHTLTGRWIAPCVADLETCSRPNEPIERVTASVTVEFTP